MTTPDAQNKSLVAPTVTDKVTETRTSVTELIDGKPVTEDKHTIAHRARIDVPTEPATDYCLDLINVASHPGSRAIYMRPATISVSVTTHLGENERTAVVVTVSGSQIKVNGEAAATGAKQHTVPVGLTEDCTEFVATEPRYSLGTLVEHAKAGQDQIVAVLNNWIGHHGDLRDVAPWFPAAV